MPNHGLPLDVSDDELELLSQISESDIENAKAWAREYLPHQYRAVLHSPDADSTAREREQALAIIVILLLFRASQNAIRSGAASAEDSVSNAEGVDARALAVARALGDLLPNGTFLTVYDRQRAVYRLNQTLSAISPRAIREAFDMATRKASLNMSNLVTQLAKGELSLADWQLAMMRELKNIHLAQAAAAKGGWAQMTQADFGRVGARIKKQYQYLRNYGNQIATGAQRLDGSARMRSQMYAQSGRSTYHFFERGEMEIRGYSEERNILGVADHCHSCVEQSGLGWVPIGSLLEIGSRACKTNCHCFIEYRHRDGTVAGRATEIEF